MRSRNKEVINMPENICKPIYVDCYFTRRFLPQYFRPVINDLLVKEKDLKHHEHTVKIPSFLSSYQKSNL